MVTSVITRGIQGPAGADGAPGGTQPPAPGSLTPNMLQTGFLPQVITGSASVTVTPSEDNRSVILTSTATGAANTGKLYAADYGVAAGNTAAQNATNLLAAIKAAISARKTLVMPMGDIKCAQVSGTALTSNSSTFAIGNNSLHIEIPYGCRILRQRGSFWIQLDTSDEAIKYPLTSAAFTMGSANGQVGGAPSNLYTYSRSLAVGVADASAFKKYDRVTIVTVLSSGYLVTNDSGDNYGYPVEDLRVLDVNYVTNTVYLSLPDYRVVTAANSRIFHWPNTKAVFKVTGNGDLIQDLTTGNPEDPSTTNADEMFNVVGCRLEIAGNYLGLYDTDRGLVRLQRTLGSKVTGIDSARTRNQSVDNDPASGSANDTRKLTYIVDDYANKDLLLEDLVIEGCRHITTGNTNKTTNRRTITKIDLTNPLKIYHSPAESNLSANDEVYIDLVGGTTQLNQRYFTVASAAMVSRSVNSLSGITKATATRNITSITRTGSVATATTDVAHDFAAGQTAVITGAPSDYNGTVTILATPSTTTFTYAVSSGATTPATLTSATAVSATSGAVTLYYSGSNTGIFANGDAVMVTGVSGMTGLNDQWFTVGSINTTAKTFTLVGSVSNQLGNWTSGGTVGYGSATLSGVNGTSGYSSFTSGGFAFEVSDWVTNGAAINRITRNVVGRANQGAAADSHAGEINSRVESISVVDPVEYFDGLITPKGGNFRGNGDHAATVRLKHIVQAWTFDGFAIRHAGHTTNLYTLNGIDIESPVWEADQDLFGGAGDPTNTTDRTALILDCTIRNGAVGRICNMPAGAGRYVFDNLNILADLARVATGSSSRYLFTNNGGGSALVLRNTTLDFRNSAIIDSTGAVVDTSSASADAALKRFGTLVGDCEVELDNVKIYGLSKFDPRYGLFGTDGSGTKIIKLRGCYFDDPDFPISGIAASPVAVALKAATRTLTITASTNLNGETVTIDGVTYTFRTALSTGPTVAFEVLIGASAATALANLAAAINGAAGIGTTYSVGTVTHSTVSAGASGSSSLPVTAKTAGTAGNSIAISEALTDGSWASSATTLGGGVGFGNVATAANPVVLWAPAHGYSTGDLVHFAEFDQMTQINNKRYKVTVVDGDRISIPVNGTAFTPETSGGKAYKITTPGDVTIIRQDAPAIKLDDLTDVAVAGATTDAALYGLQFSAASGSYSLSPVSAASQDGSTLTAFSLDGITSGFAGSSLVKKQAGIQTTNNTATVIASVPLAEGEAMWIQARALGLRNDFTEAGFGDIAAVYRRATGGNVVQVSTAFAANQKEDSSGTPVIAFNINTSTQEVEIRVTGETSKTFNWVANYEYSKVISNT